MVVASGALRLRPYRTRLTGRLALSVEGADETIFPLVPARQEVGERIVTPEEFRRVGHQLIDRIADYRAGIASRPVMSDRKPGETRAALPREAPLKPESFEAVF